MQINETPFQEQVQIEIKATNGHEFNEEDAAFEAEVAAIKTWWSSSRWSNTKRPYTAEQICSKRGNLQIQYASNDMSKKLWEILEHKWQVCSNLSARGGTEPASGTNKTTEQRDKRYLWLYGSSASDSDGKVPRHSLCLWMAMFLHSFKLK